MAVQGETVKYGLDDILNAGSEDANQDEDVVNLTKMSFVVNKYILYYDSDPSFTQPSLSGLTNNLLGEDDDQVITPTPRKT